MAGAIEEQKQALQDQLSKILASIDTLQERGSAAAIEQAFSQAAQQLTQLYYLNLYQIDASPTLKAEEKAEVQQSLVNDYQRDIVQLTAAFARHGGGS